MNIDWGLIIAALGTMSVLGGLFGLGLAAASRKFAVKMDPRVEQVLDALPNVNCGACGFAGCADYAEAVVLADADVNLCVPGGPSTTRAVAAIMGVEAVDKEAAKAIRMCQCEGAPSRFIYDGLTDCRAGVALAGGFTACRYACVGLGTCVEACPFGAIRTGADSLPVVDEEKCTGCGQCVKVCPRDIFEVRPVSKTVHVLCRSRDKGATARKACLRACIACKRCEKACPFDAIHVVDNLARIDYDKCTTCGKCVEVCPNKCIVDLQSVRGMTKHEKVETVADG